MATRPLGVAIVGCGGIGASHAWALTRVEDARIVACVDVAPDRAASFARRFGGEAFADPEQALRQPDVEAVVVTTANDLHAPLTVAALDAGKHVLVQKPMALTLAECDSMVAAADRAGRTLMVSFFEFFHPAFARAKALVDRGVIGRVFLVKAIMAWHMEATSVWRFDPAVSGGGIVMDGHAHHIAFFHWLVPDPTLRVYTEAGTLASDARVEDTAVTIVRTLSAMAEISGSMRLKEPSPQNGRYFKESIEIFGMDGTIHIKPQERPSLRVYAERADVPADMQGWAAPTLDWVPYEDRGRSMHFNADEDPWVAEHRHFVGCILRGEPPVSDGRFGRRVMETVFAGYESVRRGCAVTLPLDVAQGYGIRG